MLNEPDSHLAHALATGDEELLLPDFWLGEATNVLWLQVHRRVLTAAEAREGLSLLRALVEPTPTAGLDLHAVALDIGMATDHSTYDTLYLAFAIAMGARGVVVADAPLVRNMRRHPDPLVADLPIPLSAWAEGQGSI